MATTSKKSVQPAAKPAAKKAAAPPKKASAPAKAPAKDAVVNNKAKSVPAAASKPAAKSVAAAKNAVPAKSNPVTKKTANTPPAKSAKPAAKAAAPVKKAAPAPAKKAAAPLKKVAAPVATKKAEAPAKKVAAPVAAKKAAAPAKPAAPAKAPAPVKAAPAAKPAAKSKSAKPAAKPNIAVLPPKPAPKPSPAPNAYIGRDEKKPATVVAHRRPEGRSKDEGDTGMTMISYKPDFTRSILDQQKEQETGPVYRYSDEELREFRELIGGRLESARKELGYLQGLLTHKGEAGTEDTDNRYMNMEDGSGAMERENLAQLASRQIQFINHLEKALIRIENKTYGICRVTGKLIDKARLRAVPHATLSVEAKKMMAK